MPNSTIDANDSANAHTIIPTKNKSNDDKGLLNDVALVGSDGGRIIATKSILASHSPFFHQMFCGVFQEADKNSESVSFEWPSTILSTIVKYCNAGEWPSESFFCEKQNGWLLGASGSNNEEKVLGFLQLREAANYFALAKLHRDLTSILKLKEGDPSKDSFAQQSPGHSKIDCFKINLAILEELKRLKETTGDLWDACQETRWELASRILYTRQKLAFFQEFKEWGWSSEYVWESDQVEEKILPFATFYRDKIELILTGSTSNEPSDFEGLKQCFFTPEGEASWPIIFEEAIADTEKVISILCSIADDTAEFRRKFIDDEIVSWFGKHTNPTFPFQHVVNLRLFKKALEPCTKEEEAIFKSTADSIDLNSGMPHEYDTPVYYLIKPCSLFPKKRWEEQIDFFPGVPKPLDEEGWKKHRRKNNWY